MKITSFNTSCMTSLPKQRTLSKKYLDFTYIPSHHLSVGGHTVKLKIRWLKNVIRRCKTEWNPTSKTIATTWADWQICSCDMITPPINDQWSLMLSWVEKKQINTLPKNGRTMLYSELISNSTKHVSTKRKMCPCSEGLQIVHMLSRDGIELTDLHFCVRIIIPNSHCEFWWRVSNSDIFLNWIRHFDDMELSLIMHMNMTLCGLVRIRLRTQSVRTWSFHGGFDPTQLTSQDDVIESKTHEKSRIYSELKLSVQTWIPIDLKMTIFISFMRIDTKIFGKKTFTCCGTTFEKHCVQTSSLPTSQWGVIATSFSTNAHLQSDFYMYELKGKTHSIIIQIYNYCKIAINGNVRKYIRALI